MLDRYEQGFSEVGLPTKYVMVGSDQDIWEALCNARPEIPQIKLQVEMVVPRGKRAVEVYQAAALYTLARLYSKPPVDQGGRVLEVGTFTGYSAAWIATGVPGKKVVTLNPKDSERAAATMNLRRWRNVQTRPELSWDYLEQHDATGSPRYDFIFVDGDHKNVRYDLPWLNFLTTGGMILFHDYSPETAHHRPCPPVFDAINDLATKLRPDTREPDVLIVDQHQVGMAGFIKGATDRISPIDPLVIRDHPLYRSEAATNQPLPTYVKPERPAHVPPST